MVRASIRIDKLLLMPSKFHHCISSLDDWHTEDDLFKREDFFDTMVSFLNDLEDEWVMDTLNWWNRWLAFDGIVPTRRWINKRCALELSPEVTVIYPIQLSHRPPKE